MGGAEIIGRRIAGIFRDEFVFMPGVADISRGVMALCNVYLQLDSGIVVKVNHTTPSDPFTVVDPTNVPGFADFEMHYEMGTCIGEKIVDVRIDSEVWLRLSNERWFLVVDDPDGTEIHVTE